MFFTGNDCEWNKITASTIILVLLQPVPPPREKLQGRVLPAHGLRPSRLRFKVLVISCNFRCDVISVHVGHFFTFFLSAFSGQNPYVHDQAAWDLILFELASVGLNPPADPGYLSDDPDWTEPTGATGNRMSLVQPSAIPPASPSPSKLRKVSSTGTTPEVTPVKDQTTQAGPSVVSGTSARTRSPETAVEIAAAELVKQRKSMTQHSILHVGCEVTGLIVYS